MKLQAEIDGEKHDIEIESDGREVIATVDGRRYVIDASEPEKDTFLLKAGNSIHEARVSATAAKPFHVRLGADEFEIKIIDPKRLRGSATDEATGDGVSEIRTAMPGKVVRIVADVGTSVEKGDSVIVVEAMKMQNELKSTRDGVVADVRVAVGDTVNSGDVLVVIG